MRASARGFLEAGRNRNPFFRDFLILKILFMLLLDILRFFSLQVTRAPNMILVGGGSRPLVQNPLYNCYSLCK